MNFKLDPNADTNGTSFCGSIEDITAEMMQHIFGDPVEDGYYDPWKGYTGNEWYFTSDEGQVVAVYDRKNRLSVGAHSHSIFEPFAAWLRDEVQKSQSKDKNLAQRSGSSHLLIRVAGVSFGDRQQVISRLSLKEAVRFRRDPENPYDYNAVKVETLNGEQIGFVPRGQAPSISTLLNLLGGTLIGWVNELKGGVLGYPNRGVVVGVEIPLGLTSKQVSQQCGSFDGQGDNFMDDGDQTLDELARDWGYKDWEAFDDTLPD